MTMVSILHILLSSFFYLARVTAVELTFELPDSAKECFHQIIEKDTESTLEFQVIRTHEIFIFKITDEMFLSRLSQEAIMM